MYFPFFIVKRPNSAKRIQRILHRYAALFDLDSGVPLLEVAVLLAIYPSDFKMLDSERCH